MAAPIDVIQLDPHDDVVAIRDRLAFVESYRVLLVWPEDGSHVLRRKLDLVLLQRAARRRGSRLALLTDDIQVIDNASDLHISTFYTLEQAQRHRWKRGLSNVFVDRSDRPEGAPNAYALRDSATRLRATSPLQRMLRRAARIVALLLMAAALFGVAYVFLPSATVTITPAREHLSIAIDMVADPAVLNANLEGNVIPATLLYVEVEESASIESSGYTDSQPTLARGTIVFTSETGEAVTIPAGTIVSTESNPTVRFQTLEPINIAGQVGAIAAVAIEALPEYAGDTSNVRAYAITTIEGPLNDILTAQNVDPTSGGSSPANRVVAQADHDRLTAAVRGAIQQRALTDLTPMLGDTQVIIPESIRIIETRPEWTTFSASVGEGADSVSLTMRARVQAVVIDERMVNQVAFAGLTTLIPPGKIIAPETVTFTRGDIEQIEDNGRLTFMANVESDAVSATDAEQVRRAIAGMSREEALLYLLQNVTLDPLAEPEITVWPGFFGRMPLIAARIQVIVREAL